MRAYECLYDKAVGRDFIVVTLKSLINDALGYDQTYDYKIDVRMLPKKQQKLGEGRYLVHVDNVKEYMDCYTYCLEGKRAFVLPEEEFNNLLLEFMKMFRIDKNEEIIWVRYENSFNDMPWNEKLDCTLQLDVMRYDKFYHTVLYKVPPMRERGNKTPEDFMVQYLIEHENDEEYQTAIKFYKYVVTIKQKVMVPVYSIDGKFDMICNQIEHMIEDTESKLITVRLYFNNGTNRIIFTGGKADFCKQLSVAEVQKIKYVKIVNSIKVSGSYKGFVQVRRNNKETGEDTVFHEYRMSKPNDLKNMLEDYWGRTYEDEIYVVAKQ